MKHRIAIFGSHWTGLAVLKRLTQLDEVEIKVVATDDPENPICNANKRIWKYFPGSELPEEIKAFAQSKAIPVFTEDVNSFEFRDLLKQLNVESVLMCCFGQILKEPILGRYSSAIRNIHPTFIDKSWPSCRGANAFENLLASNSKFFRLILHEVERKIDAGRLLLSSSPIQIYETDCVPDLVWRSSSHAGELAINHYSSTLGPTGKSNAGPEVIEK